MRPDIAELIDNLMMASKAHISDDIGLCFSKDDCKRIAVILQAVFDPENQPSQFGTKLID